MRGKFTYYSFMLCTALALTSQSVYAQISGNVTVGDGGDYATFTGTGGLFETINSVGLNGNLSAAVISDINEPGATPLNQWVETPASSGFTLTIAPVNGTPKVISGTSSAGLFTLNGADRVTVDGSFSGPGQHLLFRNASTGSAASVFTLTADAQNDTIRNCIIEGSSATSSTTTAGAVIYMGPGAASGNDNNAITGNIVKNIDTAAGVPNFLFKSLNSVTAAASSENVFIYGNEFLNFGTQGTYVGNVSGAGSTIKGANSWIIRKNAYYQQSPRSTALTCIQVATGGNHLVDSNNIGGSDIYRGGAAMQTSATPFYGINITSGSVQTTSTTPVTISGNNISNIYVSNATGIFYGIYSTAYTKIQDNIVGSNNLISDTIRNAGTSNMGIMVSSAANNLISGNSIKNMKSYAIANVMSAGINVQGGGTYTIDQNIIDSISSNTGATQTGGNALCGINIGSQSGSSNAISRNQISNLILTHASVVSCAAGILTQNALGAGALKIFGNKINKIMGVSSAGNALSGIYANFTASVSYDSIYNNMIVMGDGTTGNSTVHGIVDASNASTTHTCVNNSVVITGTTDASANVSTTAYYRRNATTSTTLRNNIFVNLRTITGTGTTGKNYAILNNAAATTTSWKSSYNLLYNIDQSTLVYWQPAAAAYNISAFKNAASSDTSSLVAGIIPFVDLANGDLHIDVNNVNAWNVFGRGLALSKTPTDIDGNIRSTVIGIPTTVGAHEIGMPTVPPADMEMEGALVPGGTTVFSSGGRKVAEITWGTTVPASFTTAKYYPGVPAPDNTFSGPNMNSYFELNVTPDVNTYDYTIKTYYSQAEGNGIADAAMTGIKKHGTEPYIATDAGGTYALDINGKYLTSGVLNDFSIFSVSGNAAPLAINLKTISAKNFGDQNRIDWSTAAEEASDYFELERSNDGNKFVKIATISASGQAGSYSYMDKEARKGMNYYRLKMAGAAGSFIYSKTVIAEVVPGNAFQMNAFPNPTSGKVNIVITGIVGNNATIVITDVTGRAIDERPFVGNVMELDMSTVASGIFYIKYTDDERTQFIKMSKY